MVLSAQKGSCVGMLVAFVAGPYRDERGIYYVRENIEKARAVSVELWKMGFAVICPHLNTALMDGVLPDYVWLEGSREILKRAADVVVMLPGSECSVGSMEEQAAALEEEIGIFWWPDSYEVLKRMVAEEKEA